MARMNWRHASNMQRVAEWDRLHPHDRHHEDWNDPPRRPRKKPATRPNPVGATMTEGHVGACPACGLLVHVAGRLLSYHAPINGCQAAVKLSDGRWST